MKTLLLTALLLTAIPLRADTPGGFIPYSHELTAIKAQLSRRVVTIVAPQNLNSNQSPRPVAHGFGVVLRLPKFKNLKPATSTPQLVLLTALGLVEKADKIAVKTPDGTVFRAQLWRRDPHKALALLTVSSTAFWHKVTPTTLASPTIVKPQTIVFVVAPLPNNDTAIAFGRLIATELKTPLAGYWGNDIAIVNGLPLFTRDGKLVALNFRYGFGTNKMGLGAAVSRISEFLKLLMQPRLKPTPSR